MTRTLLLLSTTAFVLSVVGFVALYSSSPTAQAQPPVCVNLAPGDHTFTAPSRDRPGDVSFTVSVGEGGVVTSVTEPGGQSLPPPLMLELFAGDDPYPLPEGVAIVECDAADSLAAGGQDSGELCLNLEPGSYEESVSASGQTYNITIHVGENGRLISVDVLGQSYAPSDALALLAQFGASVPPHIQILPCEPVVGAAYPTTGTGGLADSGSLGGLWAGLATLSVLAIAIGAVVHRRRTTIRVKDDR